MPPRPPPPPPILTILCTLAALVAVWAAIALDQWARGTVGRLSGVPLLGYHIAPERWFTLVADQGPAVTLGAWSLAFAALAGPLVAILAALVLVAMVGMIRARGWLRGFTLSWTVVVLLWLPLGLIASALPGGGGPMTELYQKLGAPQAGRWTAAALGLVLLVLVAGPVGRLAVREGKRWMRADGVAFRRRLVRVTVGWPGVAAAAVLAFAAGWAPNPWAVSLLAAVLASLHFRTA